MAVIPEYEEEEPVVQTAQPQAPAEVQHIRLTPGTATPTEEAYQVDKQNDAALNSLLEVHNQQPLKLLTAVVDFLFRETDLSQQEGVESRVSEMVGVAKKRKSDSDAEGAAAVKVAKVDPKEVSESPKEVSDSPKEVSDSPKEVFVDLSKSTVDENVEEVNIASSPVAVPPEDDEPDASEVKENIVPDVDDMTRKSMERA